MVKEFSDLKVWQEGKDLIVKIYRLTKSFPKQEMYGLVDQLKRASNSICANIAEGFSRYHTKDKIRFYYHSRGSISECKSHVLIAEELGYLSEEDSRSLVMGFDEIGKKLNAMINSLYKHS